MSTYLLLPDLLSLVSTGYTGLLLPARLLFKMWLSLAFQVQETYTGCGDVANPELLLFLESVCQLNAWKGVGVGGG